MLTARTDEIDYVEAVQARRGAAYRCRGCGAPVVLKSGQIRIAHFAHRPDAGCAFGSGMSLAHLTAQRLIADALRGRGLEAQLEAVLPSLVGDRRTDVLAWSPDQPKARVAVEVQASDLTVDEIAARTASYGDEGVAPLWLRLLDFAAFDRVQTLPHRGAVWLEAYRARAWERWAHDHLGGRLWLLDQGPWLAWRGTFVQAHTNEAGASDWREVSQWVDLELEGPFALTDLRLARRVVRGPDGVRRLCAAFAPTGDSPDAAREPGVRARLLVDGRRTERDLQVRVDGRWIPALVEGARSDWRTVRGAVRPVAAPL